MNIAYVGLQITPKNFMIKILLASFLTILFSFNASACSCSLFSIDERVKNADQIYFATLLGAKVVPGDYPAKWPHIEGNFQVRKLLKGKVESENVTLTTGMGNGDCGVSMFVAETYIIFKESGRDGIGICGGSGPIYTFQEDEIEQKIRKILKAKAGK